MHCVEGMISCQQMSALLLLPFHLIHFIQQLQLERSIDFFFLLNALHLDMQEISFFSSYHHLVPSFLYDLSPSLLYPFIMPSFSPLSSNFISSACQIRTEYHQATHVQSLAFRLAQTCFSHSFLLIQSFVSNPVPSGRLFYQPHRDPITPIYTF